MSHLLILNSQCQMPIYYSTNEKTGCQGWKYGSCRSLLPANGFQTRGGATATQLYDPHVLLTIRAIVQHNQDSRKRHGHAQSPSWLDSHSCHSQGKDLSLWVLLKRPATQSSRNTKVILLKKYLLICVCNCKHHLLMIHFQEDSINSGWRERG